MKFEAQLDVNLKKICDNYEKASNDVKTAISKLAADEDGLEAQIRQVVLAYKKTAVQVDNPDLESALQQVIAAFP